MQVTILALAAVASAEHRPRFNWIRAAPAPKPELWDVGGADAATFCADSDWILQKKGAAPLAATFELGRLALDAAGASAHMRASVGPGAAFECRLDRVLREGPLRVPCEVISRVGGAYDNGSTPYYYDIVAKPEASGTYDLRLLWMHASAEQAFGAPSKPLCRILRDASGKRDPQEFEEKSGYDEPMARGRKRPRNELKRGPGDDRVGRVKVPRAPVVRRPCSGYGSHGPRADAGNWRSREWQPKCIQTIYDRNATDTCFARVRPLLVGDSHTRLMFDTLTPQPANLTSDGDVAFLAATDARARLQVRAGGAPRGVLYNEGAKLDLARARGRRIVVASWGHWRLREGDVEAYMRDWRRAIRALAAALPPSTTLVWRTMPAYSYRRDLDGRTNAKVRHATQLQRAFLAKELPRVLVHDTFAITAPRLFDANSKHHYLGHSTFAKVPSVYDAQLAGDACGGGVGPRHLCPWVMRDRRGVTYTVGNAVGLADMNALLNLVCNDWSLSRRGLFV